MPTTFENNWRCTTESLQAAYDQAEKAGIKIKVTKLGQEGGRGRGNMILNSILTFRRLL